MHKLKTMVDNELRSYRIDSAWGEWTAVFSERGLRELSLPHKAEERWKWPLLDQHEGERGQQLRKSIEQRIATGQATLPWSFFDLEAGPSFYLRVWKALHLIKFGTVITYGKLAAKAGSAEAVRAVGQACHRNPIVVFIPCHRVVAANGLGGFGAGMEWKTRLLAQEGVVA